MSRVSGRAFFVYVLRSERSPRLYIGISEDPRQRLKQHNELSRGWTARYCPWVLMHVEEYPNYRAARQREIQLKSQKSGDGFFRLTGLDPNQFGRG
jgi:putative endonuclease